jgi:arylsulfatase A-like enzyme
MTRWFPTPKRRTLCAGLLCLAACADEAPRPPNVVLVIIDTLRADKVSSYGSEVDTSPALTILAEQGVQFDSVIAQSSWTLPSVGSMLTSRYPRSLGLKAEDGQMVPDEAVTLAEILQHEGYATFGITANPNLNSRYNFHQGFDHYSDSSVVFHRRDASIPEGTISYLKAPLRSTPEILAETLEFARGLGGARPGYIQLNLMEVHEWRKPNQYLRPEYLELFEGEASASYLCAIRQVTDDTVAFIHDLASLPGWADTLFIVTSDHGEGLGDHPDVERSMGHGSLLYGSHIRVPWIVYNPLWQREIGQRPLVRRVVAPLRLLDLVPTTLDALGVPVPPECRGASAWSLALGQTDRVDTPEFLVAETYFRGVDKISAVGGQWQYIHNRAKHPGLPRYELQANDQRPNGIQTDASGTQRRELRRMRTFLEDWELRHPSAEPVPLVGELSPETEGQLRAIGYLGGDEEGDD